MQALLQTAGQIISNSPDEMRMKDLLMLLVGVFVINGLAMASMNDKRQLLASAIKFPLLLLSTLMICLPALLMLAAVAKLPLGGRDVISAILRFQVFHGVFVMAFVPVVVFFSVGSSYDFMKLLHVGIHLAAGLIAMGRLLRFLLDHAGAEGLLILLCWACLYAFVGCQMAWYLRPMIGSPGKPFEWIRRGREMNFYTAIMESWRALATKSPDDTPEPISEVERG